MATAVATTIISVVVARVRHTSDGFSVYTATVDADDPHAFSRSQEIVCKQFSGPVARGQRWTLAGQEQTDPKWGKQFSATFATLGVPRSPAELDHMVSSGLLDGWDRHSYRDLTDALGPDGALEACISDRSLLSSIPRITDDMIASLTEALRRGDGMARIYAQLGDWGVTGRMADRLVKHLQHVTLGRLEADPYRYVLEIDGYGWKTADALGNQIGFASHAVERLRAGIAVAVAEKTWQAGSTWLTRHDAVAAAGAMLGVAYDAVEATLGEALAAETVIDDGGRLYPAVLHRAEQAIAEGVVTRVSYVDFQPPAGLTRSDDVDVDQWSAVVMALSAPLSLLTGGPGVGKTTTLSTLVEVAREAGMQVTLMAPTGKAAARMTEATGHPATTIHSRLGLVPGVYDLAECDEPLYGLVVVDEVSMLATTLAARVFRSLAPSAHLLLVGDPDQLPSVGPGAVLRDLIDCNVIPRVHLDRVYRNDAGIATNAARIRAGESIMDMPDVRLIEACHAAHAADLVQALVLDYVRDGVSADNCLVLCPTNDGESGRHALNAVLQPLLNASEPGSGIPHTLPEQREGGKRIEEIRVNDRVLVTANNRELGVFNGQAGIVVDLIAPKSITVLIEGKRVVFKGEDKRSLTLAYAITGHKAQGSEAKIVIAPIFASRVLSREWLYTVLTRARERAYLVGDVAAMQACLAIRRTYDRETGLVSRIAERMEAGK